MSGALGLVSKGDEGNIMSRHTSDSLLFAAVRTPQPNENWIDVGTGAGFPGLVLAICYPRTYFVLLDSNKKKLGFLRVLTANLGLTNVELRAERSSETAPGFDVAVARALANPEKAIGLILPLVSPGGEIIVAATEQVEGAEPITTDFPEIDSPGRFLKMTRR
ncbi:MAG: 16S rRNA (guanine(527)-N(7))-methyltransferase RsmG [Actinomycetota bacterium]